MDKPPDISSDPPHAYALSKTNRPSSPVPSGVSLKSDDSMDKPPYICNDPPYANALSKINRPSSPVPSDVSLKSDDSMDKPPDISSDPPHANALSKINRPSSPVPSGVSLKSDDSMDKPPDFSNDPPYANALETAQTGQSICGVTEPVNICGHKINKQTEDGVLRRVIENHKASLKKRFEKISEGIVKPIDETLLNKIYTQLYITEGENEGVNKEHEVWQVESACGSDDAPINCNDIFMPLPGQEKDIRMVMTKGVAGIGKTVSVQKFILDWIDGVANHNVDLIFPLSFRELNLVKNDQYSLHTLLLDFFPELKELKDGKEYKDRQVVFIFDGLDESRLSLHLQERLLSDVNQTSSVDVLMMSLIQGTLLPSALIWITSRPAAASQIPAHYINLITEIRGFSDTQKEEYFRKRISDESQANRIISHIKASRSLHIMCHIPVFCWITATVLQQILEQDNTQEIPKTLTEMFIHFLIIQTARKNLKYQSHMETNTEQILESQKDIILRLSKLAFRNLENGNLMFYEQDLKDCGIDVSEASIYSGMCTEIFKEESLFQQRKVYCFVHLTIQEFLAALHVFVSYSYQIENMGTFFSLEGSLKHVINKVLESKNGYLDLFLCLLVGISLERNQRLLKGLLSHIYNSSESINKMCQYIKELNKDNLSPERCISLLQCLSEVNDHSIHEEIQQYLESPTGLEKKLSPAHCSALAHILLMSEEVLDEFDLKKYNTSHGGRGRMIPAVRCCRKARLDGCKLNQASCETLKRALQSPNTLIHLDLSRNPLGDAGVQILYAGISSPQCKLQVLRFGDCKLSGESCKIMATVLQSSNSLIELDMSHNDLGDSGIQHLCEGLASRYCGLHVIRLSGCLISEKGCGFLASALTANPSHLKELDLSYNHPGQSGLKLLSATLDKSHCKLGLLNTDNCAEFRLQSSIQKYACELTLDPNTAHRNLSLFQANRGVMFVREEQPYPDHPDRFDWSSQVLCREGLSGRCYWEAEWNGCWVYLAVAYKSIKRKGGSDETRLGLNAKSWSLSCSPHSYSAWHNNKHTDIPAPSSSSRRVGVYLDWPAGTLSFYSVSSGTLTHLHTFHSTFTEPVYAAVWVQDLNSSVSFCQLTNKT